MASKKQMYKAAKTKRRRAIQRDRWTKRIQDIPVDEPV